MFKQFIIYQLVGVLALVLTSKEKKLLGTLPISVMALLIAFWPAVILLGTPGILSNLRDFVLAVAIIVKTKVYEFLVKRGWVSLLLLALAVTPLMAQDSERAGPPIVKNPTLMIFADTAGVARVADNIYVTWIIARATPTSLPSSGVLVAFHCTAHRVKRLAHVVYHLTTDSTGVVGNFESDNLPWVAPSIPHLFDLVCSVGATRETNPVYRPEAPTVDPKHLYPIS